MTDAKVQEGETENPFSFFRTPWFKDAISQLCADGWPTFIVPLNIKINQCEEAYEALKIENESLKLQVKLLSENILNDVRDLKSENELLKHDHNIMRKSILDSINMFKSLLECYGQYLTQARGQGIVEKIKDSEKLIEQLNHKEGAE